MMREPCPVRSRARATRAFERVYRWVLGWADRPSGPAVLVLLAVLEATVFPAPTEAMLLALGRPRRAWWLGALAAGGAVAGGLAGYWMGAVFFERFGQSLLASYGLLEHLDAVVSVYRENAFLALVTSGCTPIPYLLYTMTGGAFEIPLPTFVTGSLLGRSLKYLPLMVLVYFFGPRVRRILDRHATPVAAVLVAVLILWLGLRRS